jgi:hypothetical protein
MRSVENPHAAGSGPTRFAKASKRLAWRITCVWCWLHFLGYWMTGQDILLPVERSLGAQIISILSRTGFAPVNGSLLGPILRVGWVLTITEYSVLQLVGLAFYIFLGPLIACFALLFRKALQADASKSSEKPQEKLDQRGRRRQFVVVSVLAAWFLLYGASNSRLPILLGMTVTGFLLALRLYAALSYAQPSESARDWNTGFWPKFVANFAATDAKRLRDGAFKSRLETHLARNIQEFMRYPVGKVLCFFRGARGQRRAGLLVLFQYVGNFLFLGVLAILFWALAIRFALLPQPVAFQAAFQASASRVLPGLGAGELALPWGLTACVSATAWILFVVYAGPAASVFPSLQASYVRRMSGNFGILKSLLSAQNKLIRALKRREAQF